jgi:hypothetical protein
MASTTVTRLRNDLEKMKSRYKGALSRTRSNPKVKKGSEIAIELAGSAIAGYVATTDMNRIAGFETPLIVGGGLVAFSMFAKKNQVNHMAGLIGVGMLNGYVYQKVTEYRGYSMVQLQQTAQAS